MDEYKYRYPKQCEDCKNDNLKGLSVGPFLQEGNALRLMLIGQDPTISKYQERVKSALMLEGNDHNHLKSWLRYLFDKHFCTSTIYATNLVKCIFNEMPSHQARREHREVRELLEPYFENCQSHLRDEIIEYRPNLVVTFGEPAHQLFKKILDNPDDFKDAMKDAFTGKLSKARYRDLEFLYTPIIHINTFYKHSTFYEKRVEEFMKNINKDFNYFKEG